MSLQTLTSPYLFQLSSILKRRNNVRPGIQQYVICASHPELMWEEIRSPYEYGLLLSYHKVYILLLFLMQFHEEVISYFYRTRQARQPFALKVRRGMTLDALSSLLQVQTSFKLPFINSTASLWRFEPQIAPWRVPICLVQLQFHIHCQWFDSIPLMRGSNVPR